MSTRRDFLKTVAAVGALAPTFARAGETPPAASSADPRAYWLGVVDRLASPVLGNLAARQLRARMPVESVGDIADRRNYTHLEAFGRLLAGLAPWFGAGGLSPAEAARRDHYLGLARQAMDAATDPTSPDFLNFCTGKQPVVDAAFLAHGLLRAKEALWTPLSPRVKAQVIAALKSSRQIPTPTTNNWVLFAAMVEAALLEFGEPTLEDRLEGGVRRMLAWYEGDGVYGDGEYFHFDGYNSFVIHPMLGQVLATLRAHDSRFGEALALARRRARRYAAIQERLIMPDGSFPSVGRSTTYRFGIFQVLAEAALQHALPEGIEPAQVRGALTAVTRRMVEAPGTFDADGWLQIGFCGHQPKLGETYISTGSLYLCAVGLLPLGLPPADPFWAAPDAPWTAQRLWTGEPLVADHAITDVRSIEIPSLMRPNSA